ncbi:MAG: cytochrome c oxidase assembly protein, partial [Pseudomonadota bacterium]
DRTMRVRFTADADRNLPWEFEAQANEVEVRLGEPTLVTYTARNISDEPVAGTAVYNVTPHRTGIYFAKVECFCFDEQIIMPGEEVTFPVYFFVDAELDRDRAMDDVRAITLSYTFYATESEALDEAAEEYYQSIEQLDVGPSAQGASLDTLTVASEQ